MLMKKLNRALLCDEVVVQLNRSSLCNINVMKLCSQTVRCDDTVLQFDSVPVLSLLLSMFETFQGKSMMSLSKSL